MLRRRFEIAHYNLHTENNVDNGLGQLKITYRPGKPNQEWQHRTYKRDHDGQTTKEEMKPEPLPEQRGAH